MEVRQRSQPAVRPQGCRGSASRPHWSPPHWPRGPGRAWASPPQWRRAVASVEQPWSFLSPPAAAWRSESPAVHPRRCRRPERPRLRLTQPSRNARSFASFAPRRLYGSQPPCGPAVRTECSDDLTMRHRARDRTTHACARGRSPPTPPATARRMPPLPPPARGLAAGEPHTPSRGSRSRHPPAALARPWDGPGLRLLARAGAGSGAGGGRTRWGAGDGLRAALSRGVPTSAGA